MVKGSCLCGEIKFSAEEIPGLVFNCHCSRCRKAHAAAYSTQVICQKESLRFQQGEKHLQEYKRGGIVRSFCSLCGSRIHNYGSGDSTYLSVAIGVVENRVDLKPIGECFVNDKMSFSHLDDAIPHYPSLPDFPL